MEHHLVGLNGDSNWGSSDGSLKGINGFWGDGLVSLDINLSGVLGGNASSINSLVDVIGLKVLSLLLGVLEGIFLPSTVATVGSGIAINELLLSKREEVSSGEEMSTFNSSGGRESPA